MAMGQQQRYYEPKDETNGTKDKLVGHHTKAVIHPCLTHLPTEKDKLSAFCCSQASPSIAPKTRADGFNGEPAANA